MIYPDWFNERQIYSRKQYWLWVFINNKQSKMKGQGLFVWWAMAFFALTLSGCSEPEVKSNELKQFPIQTVSSASLSKSFYIEKKWIVVGQESITVLSKVPWRIDEIEMMVWERVSEGEVIVTINDLMGTIRGVYERAKAWLLAAQSNYDTAYANLQKSLQDTFASYQFARSQRDRAKIDAERQQMQIELDLASKTLEGTWSLTSRQLDTLQKQIDAARFDLETKKRADQQTVSGYLVTYDNLTRDLAVIFEETTSLVDELYGITIINQQRAQQIRTFVSARNTELYIKWRNMLWDALNYLQKLQNEQWSWSTPETLGDDLMRAQNALTQLRELLETTKLVLNNSVTWPNFTQGQIDGYTNQVSLLQTRVQSISSSITQQKNAITAFLSTFRLQQQSIENTITILEQQRDTTRATLELGQESLLIGSQRQVSWIQSQLDAVQLQATTSETSYEAVRSTKDSTLSALAASLQNAQASYNEALAQRKQLQVIAPIQWVIDEIFVDRGQDVTPWTPLFKVSNNQEPKITISLSNEEMNYVTVGQWVKVILRNGQVKSWVIAAIAQTANNFLMYPAEIALDGEVPLLWEIVEISLPVELTYPLLPLQSITLINTQRGEISVYEWSAVKKVQVSLWKVRWNKVEIRDWIAWLTNIITTPMQTFDPNVYEITLY